MVTDKYSITPVYYIAVFFREIVNHFSEILISGRDVDESGAPKAVAADEKVNFGGILKNWACL